MELKPKVIYIAERMKQQKYMLWIQQCAEERVHEPDHVLKIAMVILYEPVM